MEIGIFVSYLFNKLNMSDRRIQQVSLDYARQYAAPDTLDENDELLVLDNLDRMDFSNKTLQPGFIMYCFCRSGKAGFLLNTQRLEMQAGDLLIGLGEQIFEDCHTSPDFNGVIIIVSRRYSQESIVGLYHLWPYLLYVIDHPVLHLSEEEQRRVGGSYDLLVRRLRHRSHRYRRETIIAQMRTFYFDICDILSRRCPQCDAKHSRSCALFDSFIRLLSMHFKTERNVMWYSDQLCLTPKYLSEAVKAVSGKTARQWITTLVIMEVKVLLRNTDLSIKEIAQELNFPNQSFLGKYFKNATNISPSDYRRS